jgi:prevent-host-death family protein
MALNLVNYRSMIRVNIAEVKANLSSYIERVESGETIVLCRRNVPIAEIRPLRKLPEEPRPVGIDRGMTIPPSFFEPLPDTLLDAFEGRDGSK